MLMADSTRVHQICLRRGFKLEIFVTQVGVWSGEERRRSQPRTNVTPPPSRHVQAWVVDTR
jgi:hypothetical protein